MAHVATQDESQANRVDAPTSFALAADNPNIRKQQCYTNSVSTLLRDHWRTLPAGTVYVEGWVLWRGEIPLEHGWLQAPDGTVYDVTFAYLQDDYAELARHRYVATRTWTAEDVTNYIEANTWYDEIDDIEHSATFPILGAHGYRYTGEAWFQEALHRMMLLAGIGGAK